MYIKVNSCSEKDKIEIFRLSEIYKFKIIDYNKKSIVIEWTEVESKINDLIKIFQESFLNRIEVARGGSVAIEAIGISNI